jgi:all-trans-8'-apo-beta-carotenal 15,15'-oxygenase
VSKSSASITHPQGENTSVSAPSSTQELETSGFSDFAPGIESAFPLEFAEHDMMLDSVEGQIPAFVRGSYFLNGPARFGSKELRYRHWLDGDGMVCSLRFDRDGIQLTNRYVQSTKLVEEREAGRMLYRAFGTSFSGSRLNRAGNGLESPVNVSVYPFGDHLLAFGEQGLPWELDRDTLATRGEFTFNGRLNSASPFAAHPKFDFDSGEMFNFGVFFSPQAPKLYLYRFGHEGLRLRKAVAVEYPCSVHDFALSKNYAIFYVSPYLLDTRHLLQDQSSLMESLRWEPERGSRLLIVSRSNGELKASVAVGHRYCLHLINAFEEGNKLVVDILEFDEPIYGQYQPLPDLFDNVSSGGPVRFTVDVAKSELIERSSLQYLQAPDFPAIDTRLAMRPYCDFWMLGISAAGKKGRKFFDQLVHASWDSSAQMDVYTADPMRYLGGEPVFIGNPQSTDGVILCQEFVAQEQTSNFLLFDAHHVSRGPIARIHTNNMLYLGFHAMFQPST